MAFYADIYGYIARREAEEIPEEVVEQARQSAAIFEYGRLDPNPRPGAQASNLRDPQQTQ